MFFLFFSNGTEFRQILTGTIIRVLVRHQTTIRAPSKWSVTSEPSGGGGLVEFCKVWLLVNNNQISYYTACYLAGYLIQLNANQGEWEKTNFIHTRFRLPELLGLSLTLPSSASTQLTSIQAEFSLLLTPILPPSQELHNKDSIRPKSCYGSCVNRQT